MAWLDDLGASFEAAMAREEDAAADDLAFSLRQDGDLRATLRNRGWELVGEGERRAPVEEVGPDYVAAGPVVVPARCVFLRAAGVPAPGVANRAFLEILGSACRAGASAEVRSGAATATGRLVRVTRDHLVLRRDERETVVGLGAVEWVRFLGGGTPYSASRGFSG